MCRVVFLLVLSWLLFWAMAVAADDQKSQGPSLDQQLLDDLDNDLLRDLDEISKSTPQQGRVDKTDAKLLEQLGQGEDVEPGEAGDPLTRIGQKMRAAEQLISLKRTSLQTQTLQKEILSDLSALIEVQKKQSSSSKETGSNGAQQKPKAGSPSGGSEGEISTPRVGTAQVKNTEVQQGERLLSETWGDLPQRYLQQLQNAGIERFLPKYEKLIEDYYKRLAETDEFRP